MPCWEVWLRACISMRSMFTPWALAEGWFGGSRGYLISWMEMARALWSPFLTAHAKKAFPSVVYWKCSRNWKMTPNAVVFYQHLNFECWRDIRPVPANQGEQRINIGVPRSSTQIDENEGVQSIKSFLVRFWKLSKKRPAEKEDSV